MINKCSRLSLKVKHEIVNKGKKYNVDYDLVLDDGTTVEVKTKKTTVEPKKYYECSVET